MSKEVKTKTRIMYTAECGDASVEVQEGVAWIYLPGKDDPVSMSVEYAMQLKKCLEKLI